MCHQEPFPASYAQAFACLWDLVSPQHTHELRYAMTPHLTPMELVSIQTLEAHGNPRWVFTARPPAGELARVRFSVRLWSNSIFMALCTPLREIARVLYGALRAV